MPYIMEVQTGPEYTPWSRNACVYATEAEALEAGKELMSRWMLVTAYRATEVDEPVNYRFDFEAWKPVRLPDAE